METTYDLLRSHPFLEGMTASQIKAMSMWTHRVVFHSGARVFRENAVADRFWLIRDGHVTLDSHEPGRDPVEIDTLGPGSVLGWSWMVPPYRWHFAAVAKDEVLALEIDAVEMRRKSADDTELGYALSTRFAQVVINRLQAARNRHLRRSRESI